MKRAALYARYSSDNQREESITAQLRASRDYCKRKGYIIINEYIDEAKSGKSVDNRTSFLSMVSDAKKKLFDVIVFHKIDRNARNEYDYFFYKAQMAKVNVSYEYVAQEAIDDSSTGQLLESLMVGVAAWYSRNLKTEVKKGMNENAYKALFNGGTPPLGYDVIDKKYVVNETEAEAIRLIFDMYLRGCGYSSIIYALSSRGFKTKAGRSFGKNSLHSILKNQRYVGDYVYNKVTTKPDGTRNSNSISDEVIILKDVLPSIITREAFENVKVKMASNKHRTAAYTAKEIYLLSGLLYCECGSPMNGKKTTTRGNSYYYYRCSTQERKTTLSCGCKVVPREEIEAIIIDDLQEKIFSKKNMNMFIDLLEAQFNKRNKKHLTTLANLNKQKSGLETKLNNLYSLVEDGDADEYDIERIKKVKQELAIVKNKILDNEQPNVHLSREQITKVIYDYKKILKQKNNLGDIKVILNQFIDKINIQPDNVVVTLKLDVCRMFSAGEGT